MPDLQRILAASCLLLATPASFLHAATPQNPQVSCEPSWPNNVYPANNNIYPLLSKKLSGGRVEYYGRFKMYSPRGNKTACNVRQILFSTQQLVNDLNPGTPAAPAIHLVVQHGLFRRTPKDMIVDPDFQPQHDGTITFYTVDANQKQGKYRGGFYYAKISVIGIVNHN